MYATACFLAVVAATAAVLIQEEENERRRRRRRRMIMRRRRRRAEIHPVIGNGVKRGLFWVIYNDLRTHKKEFFKYMRMSVESFDELLGLLSSHLEQQNKVYRKRVPPVVRLIIALRYLATGQSLASLHFHFMVGKRTTSYIIRDTCAVIWDVLKDEVLKKPTKEEWSEISHLFWERYNFPNCLGAIDGKHLQIIKPVSGGSSSFNYTKKYPFVLLAVADANYYFSYIDVGSYGSCVDSNIFDHSSFGQMLHEDGLDLPENCPLPVTGPTLPFVFLGNEAFALGEHLLKPYLNFSRNLQEKVFNYRHHRAQKVVEEAFGILSNKWHVLRTPINLDMQDAITAVKSACALHNFVLEREDFIFEDSLTHSMGRAHWTRTQDNTHSANIREDFASFFMSPTGQLPWQFTSSENY
ncbi:protein ANTAGONIST OF LIKE HETEROCHROMATIN PROTEIN 1-like [Rana temporaria]|uniref:protein ANTAGONIST OF LIKE HETEROCHROMATIN PROTEIN 1-like n=1 Tax=Rana temporaria TaxID=8407 RepID=UPI001AACBB62|nr:protein ANTAGONIST OF LIKE HETEROCHROMATIN PROTEIN 1-like [Rana temporaria]